MQDRFVTVDEASRLLCVCKTSVFNLMKNGELRRVKLSTNKTVLLASDIQNFIQRKAAEAAPVAA